MKIAFASGKGGTGKTALSVNFALFCAEEEHTLLLDLDVEEPDVLNFIPRAEMLNKREISVRIPDIDKEKCDLCGNCVKACNFNALLLSREEVKIFPQLCKNCLACADVCPRDAVTFKEKRIGEVSSFGSDRLDLIEGRLDIGDIHTKTMISEAKRSVFKEYDTVIYDCPPGTTCPMVEAVVDADYAALVAEPTLFGLCDLELAVSALQKMKKPFGIIINKSEENNDIIKKYCMDNGIVILADIPFDEEVFKRYAEGRDLVSLKWYKGKMAQLRLNIMKAAR